jgi:hypothetical protein
MEKFGSVIRDEKTFGSGINIPDPQHCQWMRISAIDYRLSFLRKPEGPGPGCGELPGGGRTRRHHHHPAHLPVLARRPVPRRSAQGAHRADPGLFCTVLRIHDILVWIRIRIRGSMPLNNGSGFGPGSCFFVIDLQDANKNQFKKSFSAHYFLLFDGSFTSFLKDNK